MWLSLLLVGIFSTFATGSEIFDVTTIYDVGSHLIYTPPTVHVVKGRVHVRKNALGLPLVNSKNPTTDPLTSPSNNITCDFQDICDWNYKSWNLTYEEVGPEFKKEKAYHIRKLLVKFRKLNTYNEVYLYVTTGSSNIKLEKVLFVIKFDKSKAPEIFEDLYKHIPVVQDWDSYHSRYYYSPPSTCTKCFVLRNRDGNDFTNINYRQSSTIPEFDYNLLSLQIKNGKLQLKRGSLGESLIREWIIDETNNMYLSLSGSGYSDLSPVVPVLKGSNNLSEIISPPFSPVDNKLCLAFVIRAEQSTYGNSLDVLVEDSNKYQHYLTSISNLKDYYEVKHINIQLESNITTPIKIVVRHLGVVDVNIARISSCSTEGEDELYLSENNFLYTRSELPAYSPKILGSRIKINQLSTCLNGGVSTNDGCACRPGFTGDQCENGCGKNRFGQDCLGLCSLHDQGCQGLLLCTNLTGCHCAPGYYGNTCTEKCSLSSYGSDCSEQCGHCLQSAACNIYTGICSEGCQPGYHPPYCKQVYAYYKSAPLLSSNDYGTVTVSFDPTNNIEGYGNPELYQIQYREKGKEWLIHSTNRLSLNESLPGIGVTNLSEEITSLKVGSVYEIRIVLINKNFNKYDGDLIHVKEILTKCEIPDVYEYNISSSRATSSIVFSWSYVNKTNHWCPIEGYEIFWKDDWKWVSNFTSENQFVLTSLVPGSSIKFKVRAKTAKGYAPFSKILKTTTQSLGTSSVTNLRIVSTESSSVSIAWNAPVESVDKLLQYTITYKCIEQPACSPGCHNTTEGVLKQEKTSVTLSSLLPFAQYLVTVTPQDGPKSVIYVGTSKFAPLEIPKSSSSTPLKTNTSLTVFWDKVPVCSSFLLGYNYQLTKKQNSSKILSSGFTKDTKVSFHNLTASTEYVVKVFIVTVAGWNAEHFLSFDVITSATVPEAVRSLEVYKRGRNMLGVRWAEPHSLYGRLESFAVTHSLGSNVTTQTVPPTTCVAWPHLYCHTIEGLKTGRRYNITVSARNVEINENGEESLVSGITKESVPTAPVNLIQLNATSTSVALQWNNPNLTNGVLRSFLISVEETEKYDQENCCQVYPLLEAPVEEEQTVYDVEVSGLHPAATYVASVSAKTIALGPSQSLVIHTRPPHLPFTAEPQTELGLTWLPQQKLPGINNSDVYSSLIRAYLIIAMFNDTALPAGVSESGILDTQLESLIKQTVGKPFIFVTEYKVDNLLDVYLDDAENESTWGRTPTSYNSLGEHQLVAVQVTEYSGVYNIDLRYSVKKKI